MSSTSTQLSTIQFLTRVRIVDDSQLVIASMI